MPCKSQQKTQHDVQESNLIETQVRKNELAMDLTSLRNKIMESEESKEYGQSFKPWPTDVFVVTYPKCGTTWVTQGGNSTDN